MENNFNSAESPETQDLSREIQGALLEARLNCDILELILDRYLRNSITVQPRATESTSNGFMTPIVGRSQEMQIMENAGIENANYLVPPSALQGRGNVYENRNRLWWHMFFSGFLMALLLFAIFFAVLFFWKAVE